MEAARKSSILSSKKLRKSKQWTIKQDKKLCSGVRILGTMKGLPLGSQLQAWTRIAIDFLDGAKSAKACHHRFEVVLVQGTLNSPWTSNEDKTLIKCIKLNNANESKNGEYDWDTISSFLPDRTAKECHDRWFELMHPEDPAKGATSQIGKTAIRRQKNAVYFSTKVLDESLALVGWNWSNINAIASPFESIDILSMHKQYDAMYQNQLST